MAAGCQSADGEAVGRWGFVDPDLIHRDQSFGSIAKVAHGEPPWNVVPTLARDVICGGGQDLAHMELQCRLASRWQSDISLMDCQY